MPLSIVLDPETTNGDQKSSIKPLLKKLNTKFIIMQGKTWQSLTSSSKNHTQKDFARPKKCHESVTLPPLVAFLAFVWASVL